MFPSLTCLAVAAILEAGSDLSPNKPPTPTRFKAPANRALKVARKIT
jgi:hypothetical protein